MRALEGPAKILVVDDDADVRLLVKLMMRADDRLLVGGEAASADQALDLAAAVRPDLIVLDHRLLGHTTGLEAAPHLKAAAPRARILLLSGIDLRGAAASSDSVDAALRKDSIGELLPTVQRMLRLGPAGVVRDQPGPPRSL